MNYVTIFLSNIFSKYHLHYYGNWVYHPLQGCITAITLCILCVVSWHVHSVFINSVIYLYFSYLYLMKYSHAIPCTCSSYMCRQLCLSVCTSTQIDTIIGLWIKKTTGICHTKGTIENYRMYPGNMADGKCNIQRFIIWLVLSYCRWKLHSKGQKSELN